MRWLPLLVGLFVFVFLTRRDPEPGQSVEWGLYQIHWGRRFPAALDRTLRDFTSSPRYVMFYRDLGRPFPVASVAAIRGHGAVPIISLELWHWHKGRSDRARNARKRPTPLLPRHYPGSAHVDWVALDGYNFGPHHDEWHHWQSFGEVFDGPLRALEERFPRPVARRADRGSAPRGSVTRGATCRAGRACAR